MIRYHRSLAMPGAWLVSSRRKPRGFIFKGQEAQEVRQITRDFASVTWKTVIGYRPIGFNGKEGKLFESKKAAAQDLLSRPEYRSDQPFTGSVIPNPKAIRKPKSRPSFWREIWNDLCDIFEDL
jgi:hypothetical protein